MSSIVLRKFSSKILDYVKESEQSEQDKDDKIIFDETHMIGEVAHINEDKSDPELN